MTTLSTNPPRARPDANRPSRPPRGRAVHAIDPELEALLDRLVAVLVHGRRGGAAAPMLAAPVGAHERDPRAF